MTYREKRAWVLAIMATLLVESVLIAILHEVGILASIVWAFAAPS